MEALLASGIGIFTATGIYLLLRARTFDTVLGLTLISYAVNLFIFAMGRLQIGRPPIVGAGPGPVADPLPQALVLTAIVIGFAMTALLLVLAVRAHAASGSDHVDGIEPNGPASPAHDRTDGSDPGSAPRPDQPDARP
jgi:multicomponent K+:H+ antiporter subunit C